MASKRPSQQLPLPNWHYETAVANVEAIISEIESGDLDLGNVFDQYTTAVEQLRQCEAFLKERQQQMELLIEDLEQEPD
jgi:exodeoxyribonuclease VII small subunit